MPDQTRFAALITILLAALVALRLPGALPRSATLTLSVVF